MMRACFLFVFLVFSLTYARAVSDTVYFHVGLAKASENLFEVKMDIPIRDHSPVIDLSMPVWTPGYYQVLDFGKSVVCFSVKDGKGNDLSWQKLSDNRWRVGLDGATQLQVSYEVQASRPFVAIPYIDPHRAFIRPTGVFLYGEELLNNPVVVHIEADDATQQIATGLQALGTYRFFADNFDVLYDSPLLVGDLQELPAFTVGGKSHRFLGYGMVDFDKKSLMQGIEKIVRVATDMMGDIPYEHYTFIGLGAGNGGIEQLNSTAISFTGEGLDDPSSRLRTLSFIAHEYFHHYNVKRIRPVALGPFDYSRPNRTDGLWLSEGLTVYYEGVLLNRAGLMTGTQVLEKWQSIIQGYENNSGKTKQTLAESSLHTWEDGPFGKRGETISFYEKGPIIGMLLDASIRSATDNEKSLDDLMRSLYYSFYKDKNRGFTAAEVKHVCEELAGHGLDEVFSYIYSTDTINYQKYFSLIGLEFETKIEDGKVQVYLKPAQEVSSSKARILEDLFGLKN